MLAYLRLKIQQVRTRVYLRSQVQKNAKSLMPFLIEG